MKLKHIDEAEAQAHPIISKIFAADATLDLDAFLAVLVPDARLRIGSQPELRGHAAISQAITGMFSLMRSGIKHALHQHWQQENILAYEATAKFSLKDGRELYFPYVNCLTLTQDERVSHYKIYIDLSPLHP